MKTKVLSILIFLLSILTSKVISGQNDSIIKFCTVDDLQLSGTLTMPADKIVGLVVLVSVAGPTDRDLSLGNHKYFKKLADGLAANGIASIRYDDRGVGESEGDILETDFKDRTLDACQAMKFLKAQFPDVTKHGYIGMSEGAGISAYSLEQCPGASFVIMLSPPVRPGRVEMKNQMSRLLETSYFTDEQKESIEKEAIRFIELVGSERPKNNREEILELLKGRYGSVVLPPYQFVPKDPEEKTNFVLSPWYQSQLNYDVSSAVSNIDIPALAIFGSLDMAIDPIANEKQIKGLNDQIDIKVFKGVNHLMQEANTGSPMEYVFLPTSFSDQVIDKIINWILNI